VDKQIHLSLFGDNQFFVSNEDPFGVGSLVAEISPLWTVGDEDEGQR